MQFCGNQSLDGVSLVTTTAAENRDEAVTIYVPSADPRPLSDPNYVKFLPPGALCCAGAAAAGPAAGGQLDFQGKTVVNLEAGFYKVMRVQHPTQGCT